MYEVKQIGVAVYPNIGNWSRDEVIEFIYSWSKMECPHFNEFTIYDDNSIFIKYDDMEKGKGILTNSKYSDCEFLADNDMTWLFWHDTEIKRLIINRVYVKGLIEGNN